MDEAEALQLVDAHLDQQSVTPEQAAALAVWLRENPQHADRAFQRICLHSFLRNRMQYVSPPAGLPSADLLADEVMVRRGLGDSAAPLSTARRLHEYREPATRRNRLVVWTVGIGGALLIAALVTLAFLPPVGTEVRGLWAYEGFDYPPTEPPPPVGDRFNWPTSGGADGLDGGFGWSGPWRETAEKVSVIVGDIEANAWRATDRRRLGLLGYADAEGHVLASTGIQLRTAAGPLSTTVRPLDAKAFPESMVDERGIGRDGSVLWLSFLGQSFDGRGQGSFAYIQLGPDERGFRIGKLQGAPNGNWSAAVVLDGDEVYERWSKISSGQAALIVARIIFRPGAEDLAIWLDPTLGTEPPLSDAKIRMSVPDFRLTTLTISSRYTTDFDELRIGGTFADVTPLRKN